MFSSKKVHETAHPAVRHWIFFIDNSGKSTVITMM